MSAYTEANALADAGQSFGALLWPVIEAAGLPNRAARLLQFEVALDTLADERPGTQEENAVWHAFAMKAIPIAELDGPSRTIINRKADNARGVLIMALLDDEAASAADHRHAERRTPLDQVQAAAE